MVYLKDTTEYKTLEADFVLIMNRGVQWAYAEDNNEHMPLDDIDLGEDWLYYGRYHAVGARIFNAKYPKWHVTKTGYDQQNTEYTWDYFETPPKPVLDCDEITLDIEPRIGLGKKIFYFLPNLIRNFYQQLYYRISNYLQTQRLKRTYQLESHEFNVIDAHTNEKIGKWMINDYTVDVSKLHCQLDPNSGQYWADENGMCLDNCPFLYACPAAKSSEIAHYKMGLKIEGLLQTRNIDHSPTAKSLMDHIANGVYCRSCDILNGIYLSQHKKCPRCGSEMIHNVQIKIMDNPQFTESQKTRFHELDEEFMQPF